MRVDTLRIFLLIKVVVSLGVWTGFAADKPSVRKVDFREAPEMKELAEHARLLGNDVYPKILALLAENPSAVPQQFDITFKKRQKSTATAKGKTIYLSPSAFAEGLRTDPAEVDGLIIHEMAHIAQQYRGFAPIYWPKAPLYWEEGMADYVRYKLAPTSSWTCPQCSFLYPHYRDGYFCAGAFLLYVDATYGSNTIQRLNVELRRGSYSDEFFAKTTGKSLPSLWKDFQMTPAFTPLAGEINTFLGDGKHAGPEQLQKLFEAKLKRKPPGVLTLGAREFLFSLMKQGRLPGFAKNEGVWMSSGMRGDLAPEAYPVSCTLTAQKAMDASLYYYSIVQTSKGAIWRLQKARRVGPDGRLIQEYPVE